jgi:DNA-binding SARP family transcriptional activator
VELRILGRVRLHMQEPVEVGPTKVRGLLGFLSWKANEYVHVDRIAEALWDGDTPADTAKALHPYASRLRRVFRDAGCPAVLTNEHRSYCLNIDQSIVDFHRFTATVREAQRANALGDQQAAADLFAAALALWDGPLLADLDTSWARRLRDALTVRDLIPTQCALLDTKLHLGDYEYVLHGLQPWLSDHPTNDRLATRWIRALAAAGRTDEIPPFYRDFVDRLREELSITPSAELIETVREVTTRRTLSYSVRTSSLPRDTLGFTGREDLLDQLDEMLAVPSRKGAEQEPRTERPRVSGHAVDVVALDGPPGIGKTTLVRHWARTRLVRFPGGVLHVDLAGYSDAPLVEPHAVMAMFLTDLGVNPTRIPESTDHRAGLLREVLSTTSVLVILDNARDSNQVRPLLEATSPCPALITSRQRLSGITYRDGVQLLSIAAMPVEDATALLTKRIGLRASEDPAALTRLVEQCQGLPLALRIVAEHVVMRPAVPLNELADELGNNKRLLDAGSHGDDQATTLRCTFALSYRALREAERRLFRLLGLHPGTRFSVHAVVALAGGTPDDVEHILDALVGAHLVAQEGAGRYSVHDLLHIYAADTAANDEPTEHRVRAVHRLFDWYLRSAHHSRTYLLGDDQDVPELAPVDPVEEMTFDTKDGALHWLLVERANLVACVYRAADLGYHEHVWRLAACLNVLSRHDDPRDLLDIHELGRRSAEVLGDIAAIGGCLNNKGAIYARLNDEENASRCFDLAYEAFMKAGHEHGLAVFTHNSGFVRLQLGQADEAISWFDKALTMHVRSCNERGIAKSHLCLGDAYLMLEHFSEARSHYRQSLFSSQKISDLAGEAKSLARLAKLSLNEDRFDDAVSYGEAALDTFDRVHVDVHGTATALCILATAHLRRGGYETAIAIAREAVRRYQETGDVPGRIDGLILQGQAHAASGEPAQARSAWAAAERVASPGDLRRATLHNLLSTVGVQPLPTPRTEGSTVRQITSRAADQVSEDVS